jgi:hypothetical protein
MHVRAVSFFRLPGVEGPHREVQTVRPAGATTAVCGFLVILNKRTPYRRSFCYKLVDEFPPIAGLEELHRQTMTRIRFVLDFACSEVSNIVLIHCHNSCRRHIRWSPAINVLSSIAALMMLCYVCDFFGFLFLKRGSGISVTADAAAAVSSISEWCKALVFGSALISDGESSLGSDFAGEDCVFG